ncbi:MAG: hypothetical protein AVDCRST_MAG93-9883, partial [uncultured Chloroflexia bacterium]
DLNSGKPGTGRRRLPRYPLPEAREAPGGGCCLAFSSGNDTSASHVVLLGDSVFDNAAYV